MADKNTPSQSQGIQVPLKPESDAAPQVAEREGFLPFPTNAFDRIFISALCLVAIHLLWLRFVETYIPLYGAMVVSLALGVYIFKRG